MHFYGLYGVYLREFLILRKRFKRHIFAMAVSPMLYIFAFGTAMGTEATFQGHTYLEFLLPGLIAMASMTQSYGLSSEINVARFTYHIFEEFQSAPISNISYVLAEVLAGMTRAVIATLVLLGIGAIFNISIHVGYGLWFAVLLNSFAFASLAVCLAMVVKAHSDLNLLNNFLVTPMVFLGGTFFPIERLPEWAQNALYVLPLPHASKAIRSVAFSEPVNWVHFAVLAAVGFMFFCLAMSLVGQARD